MPSPKSMKNFHWSSQALDEILTQEEGQLQETVLLVKYGPISAVMRASTDVSPSSTASATGPTALHRLRESFS